MPSCSLPRSGALVVVAAALVTLCLANACLADTARHSATVSASSHRPARFCLRHSDAVMQALRQGQQRVVVVVSAFTPPTPADATVVLWLNTPRERQEVARFGIYPLQAFTQQDTQRSQRFLVSLADHAGAMPNGQPLCLELGFAPQPNPSRGGKLRIHLELVDPNAAPAAKPASTTRR